MIPGTQGIHRVIHETRGTQYYCSTHKSYIEPLWVGVASEHKPLPACELCMIADIGGLQELKFAQKVLAPKTKFTCSVESCEYSTQGFCLMCKKHFCLLHIDEDKVLCVECLGLGGSELGEFDEEEKDLDADTSGTSWRM